ncbi:zinc transporter ZntB [Tardibacter chloracetimidivorans]|uniref:zinc transporter ZntB n=1 Tax=Tardibacter chloracetimidivorans TaxID=1921510 RepID=UPI000B0B401D|nr:zinc transporter ZntB [Tardibacter chloracetimidivorans]
MNREWAYVVEDAGKASAVPREEAVARHGHASLVWIHLNGRDSGSLEWLRDRCGIPYPAFLALTAVETRPRADFLDSGAIINLRGLGATPHDDPDTLVSIRLWAEAGFVISISYRTISAIEQVCEKTRAGRILDPGDLIVDLADAITARLDPEVAVLGDLIDDLEGHIGERAVAGARSRIAGVRSRSIDFRRFLQPQRDALERLSLTTAEWVTEEDRLHLREAANRAARMAEELEAVRERSALLHEQLTDLRTEQIDQRSLIVALIALIFLPLTFVTGLFGMNVEGIPIRSDGMAFWWIAIGSCVFGAALWLIVRWRRWI